MVRSSAILVSALWLGIGTTGALAFECPKHIDAAQQQIEKVMEDMKGMEAMMSKEDMMLVHTMVDDAKMLLESARHNHEKPQGPYDHARAIAKADAAKGFAVGADILHFHYMQSAEASGGTGAMHKNGHQPKQ